MSLLASAGALAYVALATAWDVRSRRIPNWLSAAALIGALAVAPTSSGAGLRSAALGLVLGIMALIVPFLLGAVGAGDVKFAGVAGAWLGPRLGFEALLLGTAIGLFVALASAA